MATVIDLTNKHANDAADGIVKIINAKAAADLAQTNLKKELMLDEITRQRNRQDKQNEQTDQINNWGQMMQGQDSSVPANVQGVANSQTSNQVGSNPSTPFSPIGGAIPQGGYTPQNPPPMSMADGSNQPQIQAEMAAQQSQPQQAPPVVAPMSAPQQSQPSNQYAKLGFTPVGLTQLAMARKGQPEAKDFAYISALNKVKQGTASPGEIELVKDFNGIQKSSQLSSITDFDLSNLPRVHAINGMVNEDERAQVLGMLPADVADNVQAAGEYRLDPSKVYGLRNNSGDRAKFDAIINRIYPKWDMKKYGQRQKYQNDLATGKLNQQVLAVNTLTKHLETFNSTIDALKNSNGRPQNVIVNMAKDLSGDPSITDAKFAREVVYNELERLLTQVAPTQEANRRLNEILANDAGFTQMKSAVSLLKHIMKGRVEPLRTQYKNIMGEDENGQIVFPETKQMLSNSETHGATSDASGSNKDFSNLWQ